MGKTRAQKIISKVHYLLEEILQTKWQIKFCLFTALAFVPLYTIAGFNLPYGYYTFLRILTSIFLWAFILIYTLNADFERSFPTFPIITTLVIAFLFNPVEQISFNKIIWVVLDWLSAILMLSIAIYIYYRDIRKNADPVRKLVASFSHMNHAYSHAISESELVRILSSDNVLAEFEKHVTPGKPTVTEFLEKILAMLIMLVQEMNLAEDKFKETTVYCLTFISDASKVFTQEDIDELAELYSLDIPDELSFLRGKINYELSALGILAQYAQENNDNVIAAKVESIRRQRGYSDT